MYLSIFVCESRFGLVLKKSPQKWRFFWKKRNGFLRRKVALTFFNKRKEIELSMIFILANISKMISEKGYWIVSGIFSNKGLISVESFGELIKG